MDVGRANHYLKALFPKPIKMMPKKQERQYRYVAEGEVNLTKLYRYCLPVNGVPTEIRTPVVAVKGRCPRPLDDGDVLLALIVNR